MGSKSSEFVRSWLVTDHSNQGNPNEPPEGIFQCINDDTIGSQTQQFIHQDDHIIMNLVNVGFFGAWHDARKE